ncbi:M48 family metalloprotease [Allohahella sp. A8]|uniref:M48 family metalloprotease n=1 Tax=Allohahella sp. A8 TaxID=3141461 RepID=UPI000C099770|nr:peptidase [Hahellaceae bacterium]|tara:strand:- start:15875 stop:16765 length:891 start_codon:yes stop_codon:yes gene_type:complete
MNRRTITGLLATVSVSLLTAPTLAFDLGGLAGDILNKATSSTTQPANEPVSDLSRGIEVLSILTTDVAEDEEVAIGREIAGRLLGAAPLVSDADLQRYVNRIGKWVALQSERPGLEWTFGVIESDSINAFASPGGYIFITKGLYALLNNESELAGVLGHEIGHVIRRHHLELLNQSKLIDTGSKILSDKVRDRTQVVDNLIGNGAEILARGLDKDAEYEADLIGVVLASRAGYDAYGLPVVLQEIGHSSKGHEGGGLMYKTHPLPDDRLAQLDEFAPRFPDQGQLTGTGLYQLKKR